jgi:hypothetical protein
MVVLPEPDSPTTPRVWPRFNLKLTSRTARNSRWPNSPVLKWKLLARDLTSSTTGALGSLARTREVSASRPAMWSSITISRAGLCSRLGRQASRAWV